MLIFNGKKYFVPLFVSPNGEANALPYQVVEGAKFVGKNGVVETGTMPKVAMAIPTVDVDADDEESEIMIVSINNQQTGYAEKPPAPQSPPFKQTYVKLSIDGNKAIMQCGEAKIERTVGASIATCTVNVKFSIKPSNGIVGATTFAGGTMARFSSWQNATGTITIPNVVCGSALFINAGTYASLYGWSYGHQYNNASTSFVLSVPSATGTYTAEIGALDD